MRPKDEPRTKYPVGSDKWRLVQFCAGRHDGLQGHPIDPAQCERRENQLGPFDYVEPNYRRGHEKGSTARTRLEGFLG